MIVKVLHDPKGHAEIYIDDFMVVVVDIQCISSKQSYPFGYSHNGEAFAFSITNSKERFYF